MADRDGIGGSTEAPSWTAQTAVEKVLSSPHFSNSRRLADFLQCIAAKAIAGEVQIDEAFIGVSIYGRERDYDPQMDPIARVEANRLRAKLKAYYEVEGHADPLRIRLPIDSFVPVFDAPPFSHAPEETGKERTPWHLILAVSLAAITTMAALLPLSRHSSTSHSSLAVLPFTDSLGTGDKDYVSNGLGEQIANRVGSSGKVRVAALHSTQGLRTGDTQEIGRQLKVDLVLEGAVRFAGQDVGVSARLYDAKSGRQIWRGDFKRPATDVLALEDEISNAVSRTLDLGYVPAAGTPSSAGWSNDSRAMDSYLQARYLFNSRKMENLFKSVDLYNAALRNDPKFAQAYAGLAEDYVVLAANEDQDMSQATALAKQAVGRALAIDPHLPEALLAKAATMDRTDFNYTEKAYRAAIAANPSSPNAHHWWGLNLLAVGRFSEAESEIKQAQALDPLSLYIGVHVGTVYYCARRYQDAIDWEHRLLELDPHLNRAPVVLARAYEGLGRYAEAENLLERVPRTGNFPSVMADLGHVYAMAGRQDKARQVMNELTHLAKRRPISPQYLALVQTGLGNKNEALALLEMSFEENEAPLALLRVDPRWDPLRRDARFQQLLRELSLDK